MIDHHHECEVELSFFWTLPLLLPISLIWKRNHHPYGYIRNDGAHIVANCGMYDHHQNHHHECKGWRTSLLLTAATSLLVPIFLTQPNITDMSSPLAPLPSWICIFHLYIFKQFWNVFFLVGLVFSQHTFRLALSTRPLLPVWDHFLVELCCRIDLRCSNCMFVKSTASGWVDNLLTVLEHCRLYISTKSNYDKVVGYPDKSRQTLSRPLMPIWPLEACSTIW